MEKICAKCGAAIPPEARNGVCPVCSLQRALQGESVATVSSADTVVVTPLPDEPLPRFGDYELLEEIARGGMGIVYRARQVSLDRIVAVKTLLFGPMASKDYVQRFRVEASAAASLQHPNIVAVHEVGVHQGQHYLVMDFIAGQTLSKISGGQPLPPRAAATYVKTIAEAIHFAHERGILHRDLKPSNVLIDQNDEPRVTDFGLAKRLDTDSELTLSGQILGSPNYMSPEQASGKRGKVGRQSDIYSLGAILFHLLTGRPPFVAESVNQTIQLVLEREPITPRALVAGLPRDLETICLKCLQKEPAKRYATAQALAEDLGHFLNDEPIHARRVSTAEKVWRWCRRNPTLAASLLVVLILLLIVSIGSPIATYRINQARKSEASARKQAEAGLYAADMNLAFRAQDEGDRGAVLQALRKYLPKPKLSDLRGWEWFYLWHRAQSDESFQIAGHAKNVKGLAFTPDGGTLISASEDHSIKFWDLGNSREIGKVQLRDYPPCFALSPDGQQLAVGLAHGGIELIDVQQRQTAKRIETEPVAAIAFAPDGAVFAAGMMNYVILFDANTHSEVARFSARNPFLNAWKRGLAFSPDGRVLAYSDETEFVTVWDRNRRELMTRIDFAGVQKIFSLAISRDSRHVAAGGDGGLFIYDLQAQTNVIQRTDFTSWVGDLLFSPSGNLLVAGSGDHRVRTYDTKNWDLVATFSGHELEVQSLACSPDGKLIASGGKDATIRFWDSKKKSEKASAWDFPSNMATRVVLTPEGDHFWGFQNDGKLIVGESSTFIVATNLPDAKLQVAGRLFAMASSSPTLLASGGQSGEVLLWDRRPGRGLAMLEGKRGAIQSLTFSPDAKTLAIAAVNSPFELWRIENKQLESTLPSHHFPNHLPALAFSSDARLLAVGDEGGHLEIWNVAERRKSDLYDPGQSDFFIALRFSHNDRWFATTSYDGRVKLWSLDKWRQVATLPGQLHAYYSLCFSRDDRRLAAGGNGIVRLWDLTNPIPQEVGTIRNHIGKVTDVEFLEDGGRLVSVDTKAVRVWETALSRNDAVEKGPSIGK